MLFKISLEKETHVINFKPGMGYSDLLSYIEKTFKKLPSSYRLSYFDQDGDSIDLTCNSDVDAVFSLEVNKIHIWIKEDQEIALEKTESFSVLEQKNEEKEGNLISEKVEEGKPAIHKGIICDRCNCEDIKGIRFKCFVCPDYDLCEGCEEIEKHSHPMIKMRSQYDFEGFDFTEYFLSFGSSLLEKLKAVKEYSVQTGATIKKKTSDAFGNLKKSMEKQKPKQKSDEKVDYFLPKRHRNQSNLKKSYVNDELESKIVESASYISNILALEFERCYDFSLRHKEYSKEELLVKYLENEKDI